MSDQKKMDKLYMDIAHRIAIMSFAKKRKVGSIIVKDGNIMSFGWNGTPHGFDNVCEIETENGLETKPEVIHSEQNAIAKAAKGLCSIDGATLYVTLSPCWNCAKISIQSGITRIVYDEMYDNKDSVDFVSKNIEIEKIYDGYNKPKFD